MAQVHGPLHTELADCRDLVHGKDLKLESTLTLGLQVAKGAGTLLLKT